MSESLSPTLVAWHSSDYQTALTEVHQQNANDHDTYVSERLAQLGYYAQIDAFGEKAAEYVEAEKRHLSTLLAGESFDMAPEEAIKQIIKDLVDAGNSVEGDDMASAVNAINRLDMASFETFLTVHDHNENEREAGFQEQVGRFKEHFADAVTEAARAGRLPADVDPELIAQRINHMRVVGNDLLKGLDHGSYDESTHTIHIPRVGWEWAHPSFIKEEDGKYGSLFHVAAHEASHGIGGKTVAKTVDGYEVLRSGAADMRVDDGAEEPLNLSWLEEALAEKTYMRIFNQSQTGGRTEERAFVDILLAQGRMSVSEDLAITAFLEDHTHQGQETAWSRFAAALATAYDPTFLRRLDNYLSNGGDQYERLHAVTSYLQGDVSSPAALEAATALAV